MVADGAMVIWVLLWVGVGLKLYSSIDDLRAASDSAASSGAGLASRFTAIAQNVRALPLIGGALERPFADAAAASRALQDAGASASSSVHSMAIWSGLLVALLPIIWLAARYVPARIRWVREATAAATMRIDADDLRLFAIRAIATQPLDALQRACPDPGAALAAGDYAPLAALELRRLGLPVPERPPTAWAEGFRR